eukprot:1581192-Prymnesium_polylepis.1
MHAALSQVREARLQVTTVRQQAEEQVEAARRDAAAAHQVRACREAAARAAARVLRASGARTPFRIAHHPRAPATPLRRFTKCATSAWP